MYSCLLSILVAAAVGQTSPGNADRTGQGSQGSGQISSGQQGQGETRHIDGQWQVVYVEMDGKKIENKDFANVTISDNKLTCRHDGKVKSWKLEFGPHHMVRAEEMTGESGTSGATSGQTGTSGTSGSTGGGATRTTGTSNSSTANERHSHGVYIASKEYLCFSMNHGQDSNWGMQRSGSTTSNASGTNNTTSSATPQERTGNQNTTVGRSATENQGAAGASTGHGAYGSHFVLILTRSGVNTTGR